MWTAYFLGLVAAALAGYFLRPASRAQRGGNESLFSLVASLEPFVRSAAHPSDLVAHPIFERAVQWLLTSRYEPDQLVAYLRGDQLIVACAAATALGRRAPSGPAAAQAQSAQVIATLGSLPPWPFYCALRCLEQTSTPQQPLIGRVLLARSEAGWSGEPATGYLREFARRRVQAGEAPSFGSELESLTEERLGALGDTLTSCAEELGPTLGRELALHCARRVDRDYLETVGSVWETREIEDARQLVEHTELRVLVDELERALTSDPARAVLLVGEPGVGKRTASALAALRLHERGYTIFEAGHAELIAGQIYIGEFEEQLGKLIEALGSGRRVLWLLRDFGSLSFSGRHKYSPISAIDMLLPQLERGNLRLLGCCEPGPFEQLVRQKPRLSGALAVRRVEPLEPARAHALALTWLERHTAAPRDAARPGHESLLREAAQLGQQYLGDRASPGNLLGLLSLARRRALETQPQPAGGSPVITPDSVIQALAELTGLPREMLDDRATLDLDALRAHFARRVIDQQEAVDCLVERMAMIKAGVTDATRPYGVFLFVGPTGTGKTEIAKALAEFLFGSPDRMIRIDMSELQGAEGQERILGGATAAGRHALVDRVREKPFSVVLLDEFEKAHHSVWDLFLQVFDDGRLTDPQGSTADFRHTILILTSNLGALPSSAAQLGFTRERQELSERQVLRALQASFRQEFVNRIDRIVVFRPLRREAMRTILQNELDAVFRRRGLRSRSWAVEWDDAALEFLLEQGFTEDMGARPLRRAIERHLLAPLALAIVGHQFPEGDQFLFVTSRDGRLHVQFVDPDASDASETASEVDTAALSLRAITLHARGGLEELDYLRKLYAELESRVQSPEWRSRRERGLATMNADGFWNSPDRFEVLGLVEYQDRIDSGVQRAASLLGRLERGDTTVRRAYPAELVGTLAHNLYLLQTACEDVALERPRDAFLLVEAIVDGPSGAAAANALGSQLGRMYLGWAERRRMKLEVLEQHDGAAEAPYRLVIAVTGFGAYSILASETGLHVLERPAGTPRSFSRCSAQVIVVPRTGTASVSSGEPLRRDALRSLEAPAKSEWPIVRRYRREPSPLVRDTPRGWRTGRLDLVWSGDFDLIES